MIFCRMYMCKVFFPICFDSFCRLFTPGGSGFSYLFLFFKKTMLSVQLYIAMLPLPLHSVGSGWPLCDTLLCRRFPKLKKRKKSLKIPSFTTSRSCSRRGHRAAEFPLCSLSFVICLPLPLFLLFSYHLSLFCSTPSCTSHSSPPAPPFPFYIPSCSLLPVGFSYSWGL